MDKEFARNSVAFLLVAVGYYFVYTNLVGIAAAIAFPDWYVEFAYNNKTLSLVLFSLVTTVPAAAVAAVFAGFVMTKIITQHHLWYGVLIVVCVTVYSVLTTNIGGGVAETLSAFVVPSSVIQVLMILAWWLFLPLAAFYFSPHNTEG